MFSFLKNISPTEIAILVSIVLLLFGSKIFVKLARTAGESLREIKDVKKSFNDAFDEKDSNKTKES